MMQPKTPQSAPRATPLWLAALLACAALALAMAGCADTTGADGTPGETTGAPPLSAECTPTAPDGVAPPGQPASAYYVSSGGLYTVLWPDGEIVFEPGGAGEVRDDGSLAMKFPFWRGEGAEGTLTVTGRSLHRPGLTVTAEIPDGYGASGLQATGLVFPEAGCYEVTARSGSATLTFVTRVVLHD